MTVPVKIIGGVILCIWSGPGTMKGLAKRPDCADYQAMFPDRTDGLLVGVGSGPSAGAYFVISHDYHIRMTTGLHPVLRPDGIAYMVADASPCDGTMRNTDNYNRSCRENSFNWSNWTYGVMRHEEHHIDLAIQAAGEAVNDVPLLLGQITAKSEADVRGEAMAVRDGANARIWVAVKRIDDYVYSDYMEVWLYDVANARFIASIQGIPL